MKIFAFTKCNIFKEFITLLVASVILFVVTITSIQLSKKTHLWAFSNFTTTTDSESVYNLIRIPKPEEILYRNKFWQLHKSFIDRNCSNVNNATVEQSECHGPKIHEEILVYSSFYDDRPAPTNSPQIQVLAILKIVPNPRPIYCQVWLMQVNDVLFKENVELKPISANMETDGLLKTEKGVGVFQVDSKSSPQSLGKNPSWMVEMPAITYITGRNHHFKDSSYGQRQYSCPLNETDSSLMTSHVSLTFKRGERSTIFLPVTYPKRKSSPDEKLDGKPSSLLYEHEFVVCVVQAFGGFDFMEIIEWMEFHRLLGVTKVIAYNGTMRPDPFLRSAFQYYEDIGFLSYYPIPPAVEKYVHQEAADLSSAASLNDCMMRHMYSARWIIIVDFDEVIVPVKAKNYHELLEEIRKDLFKNAKGSEEINSSKSDISDHEMTFTMAYFFKYFKPFPNTNLMTMKYRTRTHTQGGSAPKSFIDPRHCLSVFNHYCWITLDRATHKRSYPKRELAIVHHYRVKCSLGKRCAGVEKNLVYDNSALRFEKILVEKVQTVLEKLAVNKTIAMTTKI